MEQLAEGSKLKAALESEGEAKRITQVGQAEADVIRIKKVAEAEGTEKLATAMKLFDTTAINVKQLDIQKDIMIAKYKALGEAVAKADIKWIMSGSNASKFFGMNLDAETGANLDQFLKESGINFGGILEKITKVSPEAAEILKGAIKISR